MFYLLHISPTWRTWAEFNPTLRNRTYRIEDVCTTRRARRAAPSLWCVAPWRGLKTHRGGRWELAGWRRGKMLCFARDRECRGGMARVKGCKLSSLRVLIGCEITAIHLSVLLLSSALIRECRFTSGCYIRLA